jgi:hypothetical protein
MDGLRARGVHGAPLGDVVRLRSNVTVTFVSRVIGCRSNDIGTPEIGLLGLPGGFEPVLGCP